MNSTRTTAEASEETPSRLMFLAEVVAILAALGIGSTVAVGIGVLLALYF